MNQQTLPVDPNVDRMIRADIRRLKNRDHGIRERLREEYGMIDLEMADVSVCARSGLDQEAYDVLLRAHQNKHELAPVH